MKKNGLNSKIIDVVFWLIVFFILYIIAVYLMETSFLTKVNNFNFDKARKLLNEALTLTAYFLAPAVAFVLFNDWRVEHQIKNTMHLLDDLNNLSFNIKNGLGFYNAKILLEKEIGADEFRNREDRQKVLWQFVELERIDTQILIDNKEIRDIKKLQQNFKKLANRALNDLHFIEYFDFCFIIDKNKLGKDENLKQYLKYKHEFDEKFKVLEELSKQIDLQVAKARRSILQS